MEPQYLYGLNWMTAVVTSAEKGMFFNVSVCWLVGGFISRITQKLLNEFTRNVDGGWVVPRIEPINF